MTEDNENGQDPIKKKKRSYVSQTDLPRVPVDEAMRIPLAIANNYAKEDTKPLDVAIALDMSPTSGTFRDLCGAAIGYGLTEGGPNASLISLTPLGHRLVAPLQEGDDLAAKREAVLTPTMIGAFLKKYDGNQLPSDTIARNVLEAIGVYREATERALDMIIENAQSVGFLKKVKDKIFVDLDATSPARPVEASVEPAEAADISVEGDEGAGNRRSIEQTPPVSSPPNLLNNRRVYISHGRNKKIVQHLKDLISYGELEPVVSVETESPSKPVPQKVLDEMRSCSAGIIHVSGDETLIDKSGNETIILNQNVLIEIGAAMALYGGRFILLVEEGSTLPSNLQGLYEVRYPKEGAELGHEATMRLLKVLSEFKAPQVT